MSNNEEIKFHDNVINFINLIVSELSNGRTFDVNDFNISENNRQKQEDGTQIFCVNDSVKDKMVVEYRLIGKSAELKRELFPEEPSLMLPYLSGIYYNEVNIYLVTIPSADMLPLVQREIQSYKKKVDKVDTCNQKFSI